MVDDELSGGSGHNIDNDIDNDLDHLKVLDNWEDKKCLHMLWTKCLIENVLKEELARIWKRIQHYHWQVD